MGSAREMTEKRAIDRKKQVIARERWHMLAKVLFDPLKTYSGNICAVQHSERRYITFELFETECFKKIGDNHWFEYSSKILDNKYRIKIRHVDQKLGVKELAGFNNTGNIRIWPSEEILAFFVLTQLSVFKGKKIVELGGGMTCLAGVFLSAYGIDCEVDLTDGNVTSVKNIETIIKENELDDRRVRSFRLDWQDYKQMTKTYDVVLSSDCLFFDETRATLVDTMWHLLKEEGMAVVVAPKRGRTLSDFITIAKKRGFNCTMRYNYNKTVWQKHLELKASDSNYEESVDYPILLLLNKRVYEGTPRRSQLE